MEHPELDHSSPVHRRWSIAAWLLRFDAIAHVLAGIVVFLPNATIDWLSWQLGLGAFPDATPAWYLARGLPAYYAMHGGLMMYVSFDVGRYRELIRVAMRLFAGYGILMAFVDMQTPMPKSWSIAEPVFILVFSASVLWLLASEPPERSTPTKV